MKTLNCLVLAALTFAAAVQAQTTATTNPVGFTTLVLNPGYNAVSVSLTNNNVFAGKVVTPNGISGNNVTVSGTGLNIGASLVSTKQYYLEVVAEGTNQLGYVGERFEVNVAATIAAASNQVVLSQSSPTNTMSPVPNLSDYSFVLREHVTIAQAFGGLGNLLLKGTGLSTGSDQVSFFDNASNSLVTYWLRANAAGTIVQWRSLISTDLTDYSSLPIRPGVGVMLYRLPSAGAVTITLMGQVRMNSFRLPLPAGLSLVSHPTPLDHSPATGDMIKSNGWVGTGSSTASDQIQIWNGTGFNIFWFRANASGSVQQWRNITSTDTTDYMNNNTFLAADKAILLRKITADPQYIVNLLQ